ncbi:hypothetical protein HDV05_008256 [Chytridiales sp. JEL 0842]|nr:hypothetical protein HDV05_008256 [Chytridiales sp. JEL 0842]
MQDNNDRDCATTPPPPPPLPPSSSSNTSNLLNATTANDSSKPPARSNKFLPFFPPPQPPSGTPIKSTDSFQPSLASIAHTLPSLGVGYLGNGQGVRDVDVGEVGMEAGESLLAHVGLGNAVWGTMETDGGGGGDAFGLSALLAAGDIVEDGKGMTKNQVDLGPEPKFGLSDLDCFGELLNARRQMPVDLMAWDSDTVVHEMALLLASTASLPDHNAAKSSKSPLNHQKDHKQQLYLDQLFIAMLKAEYIDDDPFEAEKLRFRLENGVKEWKMSTLGLSSNDGEAGGANREPDVPHQKSANSIGKTSKSTELKNAKDELPAVDRSMMKEISLALKTVVNVPGMTSELLRIFKEAKIDLKEFWERIHSPAEQVPAREAPSLISQFRESIEGGESADSVSTNEPSLPMPEELSTLPWDPLAYISTQLPLENLNDLQKAGLQWLVHRSDAAIDENYPFKCVVDLISRSEYDAAVQQLTEALQDHNAENIPPLIIIPVGGRRRGLEGLHFIDILVLGGPVTLDVDSENPVSPDREIDSSKKRGCGCSTCDFIGRRRQRKRRKVDEQLDAYSKTIESLDLSDLRGKDCLKTLETVIDIWKAEELILDDNLAPNVLSNRRGMATMRLGKRKIMMDIKTCLFHELPTLLLYWTGPTAFVDRWAAFLKETKDTDLRPWGCFQKKRTVGKLDEVMQFWGDVPGFDVQKLINKKRKRTASDADAQEEERADKELHINVWDRVYIPS